MVQFSLFFRIIQQYQINKIKMFQKRKTWRAYLVFYRQILYLKFWAKIEDIFPFDSTRLEPEPEKNISQPETEPDPKSSTRAILTLLRSKFFLEGLTKEHFFS